MTTKLKWGAAVLAVAAAVLWARLFRLDALPGELYGDIAIMCDYIVAIQAGRWPFEFFLSSGPLYPYLVFPLTAAFGLNFFTLKLACVFISLGGLVAIYQMVRTLSGERGLALLTVAIAGLSSWMLVFSRLGNNQITLVPIAALSIWLTCRASLKDTRDATVLAAFVSALGLYVCAPGFVQPVAGLLAFAILWRPGRRHGRRLLTYVAAVAIFALPFACLFVRNQDAFVSGYIGGKFPDKAALLQTVAGNIRNGLLAFHVRGDGVFRSNPEGLPHLDPLSGLLMAIGCGYWFARPRLRTGCMLLALFFVLQLPSMLVRMPGEVPSASRTVAAVPIVYLYVASGAWWLAHRYKSRYWPPAATLAVIVAIIALLNFNRYFQTYARGLPNHNVAYGRIISDYVDALPRNTTAVLVGCCWGDWGQPEPSGIRYVAGTAARVRTVNGPDLDCGTLARLPRPAVLIWDPRVGSPSPQVSGCLGDKPGQIYFSQDGQAVFRTMNPFD
jgi:hypothetical protein